MNSAKGNRSRAAILAAGLELARRGLHTVTIREIGRRLDMTAPAVLYHFPTVDGLRNSVASFAVEQNDTMAIARLIVDNHAAVAGMDRAKRAGYLALLQ